MKTFQWQYLNAFICECQDSIGVLMSKLAEIIYWRRPVLSTALFIAYQLIIYDLLYLPASIPALMIAAIVQSAIKKRSHAGPDLFAAVIHRAGAMHSMWWRPSTVDLRFD